MKRQAFIAGETTGQHSLDVLNFPLYPYQRDGVRHLALGERRLLADEMGLGKTVQALGASQLLQIQEGVERVLVICPASLKTEWAEQISAATALSYEIISGPRQRRLALYQGKQFFTLTNYEQVLLDLDEMQEFVNPDIVILDEAQRIKNWRTKTANAVKRLESCFAFVLTGTPLENRIDELYSIMQFLDPEILGPLFRFNRDYYQLDDQGRAIGYKNLDKLREKTRSVMLRRRKADVEGDLPNMTSRNHYLPMTKEQQIRYDDYESQMAMIASRARRRPLTPEEFKRLQMGLACMRMLCDTPYILDTNIRDCPKLDELERVIEDMLEEPDAKIIIFSEWVRMLQLVRGRIEDLGIDFAWHTGAVPQDRRRIEINRFKDDPECRIFLSSESGGVGLNLQVANNVINLDLPWNPAKLEQRIARAWRKHQKRSVTVVNLVTANSIEHRMVSLLQQKQDVADNVLDGNSEQTKMDLPSGRKAFMEQLESIMKIAPAALPDEPPAQASLMDRLTAAFGDNLFAAELRQSSTGGDVLLAVVDSEELIADADIAVETHEPQLEIIDKNMYEAILRLESIGLIQFPKPDQHDLLPVTEKPEDRLEEARKNRKMALSHLEHAKRKRQMATLLSGGGFEVEAEATAPDIANSSLRAVAADFGHQTGDEQWTEENIWNICETMRNDDILTQEQQFKLTWVCQAENDDLSQQEQDCRKLTDAMEFLSYAEELLSRPLESRWKTGS
ncbi:MAG: DEAD/DEAH box helicase [Rhodobacteraceae bacterium]|nr:DEAD/DEAH box helicase [Paracoccaceae bacterium]